ELLVAAQLRQLVHIDMNVARDKQIDVAVAVVVSPCGSQAQAAAPDSCLVGNVFKLAVPEIVIERVSAVSGDVKVRQSVVVEVGHGHAHPPALAGQPGLCSDVRELKAGVLMVERDQKVAALLSVAVDVG